MTARTTFDGRPPPWVSTGKPATRDHVAPMMVGGWSRAQRRRIRAILLGLVQAYRTDADALASPEVHVVAMIDQAGL